MQNKWNVYQHWDPLKVCVVGRSYPPEFYSWIQKPAVRSLFEKIAIETEEDYQKIIAVLEKFNVEIHRPELPKSTFHSGRHFPPPMTPRDYMVMIGDTFYKGYQLDIKKFYQAVKAEQWPTIETFDDFFNLPQWMIDECYNDHQLQEYIDFYSSYDKIFDKILANGNTINDPLLHFTNGAFVTRCGKDLYFGTETQTNDMKLYQSLVDSKFPDTRNHIIDTQGHSDSSFCPVCPGLIVTLEDIIEEIVGEIDDETDIKVKGVKAQPDGSFIIDGSVTIRDLNRSLGWYLPDQNANTIAGLVLHESRTIPEPGQEFRFHNIRFRILQKKANFISQLRLWNELGIKS